MRNDTHIEKRECQVEQGAKVRVWIQGGKVKVWNTMISSGSVPVVFEGTTGVDNVCCVQYMAEV